MEVASPTAPAPLPRGPHGLSREQVRASQAARLKRALVELLADRGYGGVTIGELARRAGVSRATFYELFANKEECLLAAYGDFANAILRKIGDGLSEDSDWSDFVAAAIEGYLGELERDPIAARAFIVEMDAAGDRARSRRRDEMRTFASVLAERHRAMRRLEPTLGELPETAYLGIVLGVRELVHDRLCEKSDPRLTDLAPEVTRWVTATVEGA